jgi:hypothetical protein
LALVLDAYFTTHCVKVNPLARNTSHPDFSVDSDWPIARAAHVNIDAKLAGWASVSPFFANHWLQQIPTSRRVLERHSALEALATHGVQRINRQLRSFRIGSGSCSFRPYRPVARRAPS